MSEQRQSEKNRIARRTALRILYGLDLSGEPAERALEIAALVDEELEGESQELKDLIAARVIGVARSTKRLNKEIQTVSPRWKLERMAVVDRNLLRLGIWEILERDLAPIIIINACVELAKEFGDKTSPGFINGLLDQVCRNHDIPIT